MASDGGRLPFPTLAVWLAVACSATAPTSSVVNAPATGALSITFATSGYPLDTTGYLVRIDSTPPHGVPNHGSLVVDSIPAGTHLVRLDGFRDNCTIGGADPRQVTVTNGDTTRVDFAVSCAATAAVIVGIWDWTEHFDDPSGLTCDDTGTYVFVIQGTGFAGRSDQVGECNDPTFGPYSNVILDDTVTGGVVSADSIQFLVGGPDGCAYAAPLPGSGNHVTGTATCGTSTGTWAGDRGLVVSLAVTPGALPLPPGVSAQLGATVRNALGHPAFDRPLSWTSDDPTVAAVDSTGLVTTKARGVTHVLLTTTGARATSRVTVGGVTIADPVGDTTAAAGGDPAIDITSLSAVSDANYLTVAIGFTGPWRTVLYGYLDIDADRNPATGTVAYIDEFRTDGGSSGLGEDYVLDLSSGTLYETTGGQPLGSATMWFDGQSNTLVALIPVSLTGTGRANLAAIVGNEFGATDWVPNSGHLGLDTLSTSAPMGPPVARRRPLDAVWRSLSSAFPAPVGPPGSRVDPLHKRGSRGAKVFPRR